MANPSDFSCTLRHPYAQADTGSMLPAAVPDIFAPKTLYESISTVQLNSFKGPIVALCDTLGLQPKGPLIDISKQLHYVANYFKAREPESDGSPFCKPELAPELGDHIKLTGPGPDVYLVFNALYTFLSDNRKTELLDLRSRAQPALAEKLRCNSPYERHFYAMYGLEQLLESWKVTPPGEVYITYCVCAKDPAKDQMLQLLKQFALGLYQLNSCPVLLHTSMFRRPYVQCQSVVTSEIDLADRHDHVPSLWTDDSILALQQQDDVIVALRHHLLGEPHDVSLLTKLPVGQFSIATSGVVYHDSSSQGKTTHHLFVPKGSIPDAMQFAHHDLAGHGGPAKTMYMARQYFYWPTMHKDVTKFVQACLICIQAKSGGPDRTPMGRIPTPYLPMDCVCIDLMSVGRKGSKGQKYVLTCVDLVTRYGWAYAIKSREAKEIVSTLSTQLFPHFGPPKFVTSDRAAELTSGEFKALLEGVQAIHHAVTPYNPRSNGACERLNRTLLQLLRSLLMTKDLPWDELLPYAVSLYNAGFHRSIGNTPFYLMFLRDMNVPYDILLPRSPHENPTIARRAALGARCLELARKAISESQDKRLESVNSKAFSSVDIGDIVYCRLVHVNKRDHKILPKFHGPFRVLDLKGNTAVVKSFRSGRVKQVSLRQVRLLPSAALSLGDNLNHEQVYPVYDPATEVPSEAQPIDVSRASDLVDAPVEEVGLPADLPEEVMLQMSPRSYARGAGVLLQGAEPPFRGTWCRSRNAPMCNGMTHRGSMRFPLPNWCVSRTAPMCNVAAQVMCNEKAHRESKCFSLQIWCISRIAPVCNEIVHMIALSAQEHVPGHVAGLWSSLIAYLDRFFMVFVLG